MLAIQDLPMMLQMEQDFRSDFIVEDKARQFVSNPMNLFFGCVVAGRIVGFAYGYRHQRLDGKGDKVYIHEAGVSPAWQRQGIGRRLIATIKDYCLREGCHSFFLFTQRSNPAACALYESAGGVDQHGDNMVYFFDLA